MDTVPRKYTIRSGTIDYGKEYEVQMAALLALRCVLSVEEEMWLASNPDGVGALDDVVIKVRRPGGINLTYMLQLKHKHKEDPESITESEFLSTNIKGKGAKGAFSLKKYFEDVDLLKNSMQSVTNEEDLIKELGKFKDIYFVLFTNRPTESCNFLKTVDKNNMKNLSFINTSNSTKSNAYVFNTEQLIKLSCISKDQEYIKFYLLTNQVHATSINKKIEEELARIITKLELTQINLKEVFEKYSKFIANWAKGDLGGFYFLTLKDVLWKLTSLLLAQYEINLIESPFLNYVEEGSSMWHEIIQGKSIIFVDSTKLVNEFLIRYLRDKLVRFCNKPLQSWTEPFDAKAFYKTHNDLETEMCKIAGQATITLLDLHKCLWRTQRCPLLLKIGKEEDYKNIISILSLYKPQGQVVIINKLTNFYPKIDIDHFSSLEDLDSEAVQKVLSVTAKIQGRKCARLKDLVDETMFSHITTRDIIDILSNEFNVGTEPILLPQYFVKRSTSKVFLKVKVLEEVTDEIFLLNTHFGGRVYKAFEEVDLTNLMGGIFTIQGVNDDLMKTLASLKQTIHCLSVFDENRLEWIWSFGTIENIRPFLEFDDMFEDNIEYYFKRAVNIISEAPGMGKSTLMDYIAVNAPPNQWVLKIDLSSHKNYLKKLQSSKPSASKHFKYFCEAFLPLNKRNAKLNRMIFQKLAKERKVLILLDGFDEVSVRYKDEVTDMARCLQREGFKLWLTTRPHMKDHLERALDTFAISMKPFTTDDQTEFLGKYFSMVTPESEVNPNDFVKKLLRAAANNLQDRVATDIPLQTRLLADFFVDKWKEFAENGVEVNFNETFDLLKLYECFIDKKLETLPFEKIITDQKLFALQLVFTSERFSEVDIFNELEKYYTKNPSEIEVLQRSGVMMIDERGDLSCVHQTFAEYLAAQWLSQNFNSNDSQIKELSLSLIKERSTLRYNFLFQIFDLLVTQNCPLHRAILNGRFGEAKKIINLGSDEIFITDAFGRTALHVAANYNKASYEFGFYSDNFNDAALDIIEKLPERKEFYSIPDILGYTPLDYVLENNGSSIVAEAVYSKINYSVINARLSIMDEQSYLMRCHKLKHSMFDTLLPYYLSRKLLLLCIQRYPGRNYIDKKTRVSKYLDSVNISTSIDMAALEYLQSGKAQLYSGFSNNSYSDLRFALVFGSRENVDQLLAQSTEINKQDVDGNTALHYAAAVGDLNIIETLLSKGALSHIENITVRTPLDVAEAKQNFPVLGALMSSLLNANLTYRGRKSLLHYAAEYGNCQDVSKALKASDVNKLDNNNATPLRLALTRNKLDVAKLLLASGADVSVVDDIGRNAFHDAVRYRCEDIISAFPNVAAAVNKQDTNGDTALHLAAAEGLAYHSPRSLLELLAKGANVNLQNLKGETPVHLAAKHGKYVAGDFFRVLVQDAQVNIQDKNGETALHAALNHISSVNYMWDSNDKEVARNVAEESPFHIFGNIWVPYLLQLKYEDITGSAEEEVSNNIIELLIRRGVDVNIKNIEGDTALHRGIRKGDIVTVRTILSTPQSININEQDKNGNTYLHLALKQFRLETVLSLIAKGIDINIQNHSGQTALHVTANKNYYVAFLLLFFGADLDKQDSYGNTALHLALYESFMLTAELLVAFQARVDIKNESGDTALHCACRNGYSEIFDKPMCLNVDLNVANNDRDTPLHIAVSLARLKPEEYFFAPDNFDCEGIIRKLLCRNVDINMQNANGETVLHVAIKKGFLDVAALLLQRNADVNMKDNEDRSVLYYAISDDHLELVVDIVSNGADINVQDNIGNTPLHLACMEERTDIASFLISRNIDVNLKNRDRRTAFHYASEHIFNSLTTKFVSENKALNRKDTEGDTLLNLAIRNGYRVAAMKLLEGKVDVNVRNNNDWTSLHYAARNGYDELVESILSRGAKVDRRNKEGNSSLHLAVIEGHLDVAKLLIEKDPRRLDITNSPFGHTPLHLAIIHNNIDIIRILLDNGADAAKLIKSGQGVLHYVKDYGVAEELISKGADVNAVDQDENTPLLMVAGNDPNLAKLFLEKGAATDVQDKNGNTPLLLASRVGMLSTVLDLISLGSDVNIQNNSGDTALMAALEETHSMVTLVLLAFGANTNLKNAHQRSALSTAINSVLRVGSLHFNNKDRDWKKDGVSRYQAILNQWTSVLEYLVNNDQDLDAQDSEGNTPLHYASMNYDILEFDSMDLPEFGDDYEESYDAFHKGIATMLLSKGIDLTTRNKQGLTALDLSRFNNTDVAALLLQYTLSESEEESDSDFSL